MKNLSKLVLLLFLVVFLHPTAVYAQSAFPQIGLPCDKTNDPDPDFNSLRPYQAASCGESDKAYFCSNELQFTETFDVAGKGNCSPKGANGTFTCNPNFVVNKHTLYVDLKDAMLPILGNTELTKNSKNNGDTIDDAQKVNEYVSWYLSGVNNKAEYGEATEDQIINYSGPVQKLLPKLIQEAQRIVTIDNAKKVGDSEPNNHNQIVACAEKKWWLFGPVTPVPCNSGNSYRLLDWDIKGLGIGRDLEQAVAAFLKVIPTIPTEIIGEALSNVWNFRKPPLPWNDGKGKPFESEVKYQKAYNEWKGKTCLIIPVVNSLVCVDIDPTNVLVNSEWSEMYNYIPLANTTDKEGAEEISNIDVAGNSGTTVTPNGDVPYYDNVNLKSAPLYFAHTQEVKELSKQLNTTYQPKDYQNERVGTTEVNSCSVVNVRTNQGDNLFAGDRPTGNDGMIIPDVTYKITEAKCVETVSGDAINTPINPNACPGLPPGADCVNTTSFKCKAEVSIKIGTDTTTPSANQIFSQTVADSGSTFRKIFPKVDENAPVTCVADIPAVTAVTYDSSLSQKPNDGTQTFGVSKKPEDGAGTNPDLSFAHLGSVYEYFLKGIQTALRPKGYGEPIISGQLCSNITCGQLPELPTAAGSCNLTATSSRVGNIPPSLKKIVSAAAQTYNVPPNLLLGIMYGEGTFNPGGKFDWNEENVTNWATCVPIPGCSSDKTVINSVVPFATNEWSTTISNGIRDDLLKLDPKKKVPDGCNLIDSIYGLAWLSRNNVDGGDFKIDKCFGIDLNRGFTLAKGCTWTPGDHETVIKMWESGFSNECFTRENSCATGGGHAAACPSGGDTCDKVNQRYANPSHNACVYDVAHGK